MRAGLSLGGGAALFFLLALCWAVPFSLASQDEMLPLGSSRDEALDAITSGLAAKARGDLSRAIRRFSYALELGVLDEENRAITLNNRANCYADQEKWAEALADYNQALLLLPSFSEAYFNRAGIYYQTGDFKQAVVDYQEAITSTSALPPPHDRVSVVWARLGDHARAVAEARRAVELDPLNQPYATWLRQCQEAELKARGQE
jgi:tetratricopeptide (TPR) repeat protein